MDLNIEVQVEVGAPAKPGEVSSSPPPLCGEGCLAPVLKLLAQCSTEEVTSLWLDLHLGIVSLVDSLWSRGRILAAHHLKNQPDFWADLCKPLTDPKQEHNEEFLPPTILKTNLTSGQTSVNHLLIPNK